MTVCVEIEFQFESVRPVAASDLMPERFEVFVDGRPLGYVVQGRRGWIAELHRDTESSAGQTRTVATGLDTKIDAAKALWEPNT